MEWEDYTQSVLRRGESERIVELSVNQQDVAAGLIIPRRELVAIQDGEVRPLYTYPSFSGRIFGTVVEPSRKLGGYVIDEPYDEDGNLKTTRKVCIIRNGVLQIPVLFVQHTWINIKHMKEWAFTLQRVDIGGKRRIVGILYYHPDYDYWYNIFYIYRAGWCRDFIRRQWIGGSYEWLCQAKVTFLPQYVLGWGWD